MSDYRNPYWWSQEYESAWERVKAALRRDWDQTKHDFGGDEPDTSQDVDDTLSQAAGRQPIPPRGVRTFEDAEPWYRFGYGARRHYGQVHPEWSEEIESRLAQDWRESGASGGENWDRMLPIVRRGWEHDEHESASAGRKHP